MERTFGNLQLLAASLLCAGLSTASAVVAFAEAENMLMVEHAWSPQSPPGVSVMAGYLSAINTSTNSITVTGVSSPAYQTVEMHRSLIENGVASMVEVKTLLINPGERIEFSPGGLHLMLINRKQTNTPAKYLPIKFHLDSGAFISFVLDVVPKKVRPSESSEAHDHSVHMHHGS
jgi:copper(I)-binding protein